MFHQVRPQVTPLPRLLTLSLAQATTKKKQASLSSQSDSTKLTSHRPKVRSSNLFLSYLYVPNSDSFIQHLLHGHHTSLCCIPVNMVFP